MKMTMIALALIPAAALADSRSTTIHAPVESVQPLVEIVTERIPYESCRTERVRVVERRPSMGTTMPTLVGGLVGGTVGRVIGHNSSNRGLITGVGAAVGAAVGHNSATRDYRNHDREYYDTEEICSVEYELRERERSNGYRVSYRFGDNIYTTHTRTEPGETIPVRVRLEPML